MAASDHGLNGEPKYNQRDRMEAPKFKVNLSCRPVPMRFCLNHPMCGAFNVLIGCGKTDAVGLPLQMANTYGLMHCINKEYS